MNSDTVRRTMPRVIGLAATVGLVAGAAVSYAAPAVAIEPDERAAAATVQTFEPDRFAAQAAELPAGLATAITRDLGIAPEDYLARAAATKVATTVVDSLGDDVRSAWMADQTLHIALVKGADEARARATGAKVRLGDPLADALQSVRGQGKLAYIDRAAEAVVPVDTGLTGGPLTQAGFVAQADWQAGDPYATDVDGTWHACTSGFNGTGADGAGRILTAGHCALRALDEGTVPSGSPLDPTDLIDLPDLLDPDEPDSGSGSGTSVPTARSLDLPTPIAADPALTRAWPSHVGAELGTFDLTTAYFGEGHDAAVVTPDAKSWDLRPTVDGTLPIFDSIEAMAGAPVCKYGATSGWTCGSVLDTSAQVAVDGADVDGFLLDACMLPGDSGGPVVVGHYALGLNSGSTRPGPTCDDPKISASSDLGVGYPVSSGATNVETLLGEAFDLSIRVGAPEVTNPAADAVVEPTPTLSGRAEAAAGATVTVTVDGRTPGYDATVGADGRWSTSITQPLAHGPHTYEARTSHVAASAAAATTSAVTTGGFEVSDVAALAVTAPADGETLTGSRPVFTGTGHPGATLTLTVGDDEYATGRVDTDGSWRLEPDERLPAGRIEATVTQTEAGHSSSVAVADLGMAPGAPVVTSPAAGESVAAEHTFTGTGAAGATVSITVEADEAGSAEAIAAMPDAPFQATTDAQGAWEITLGAPMPEGEHTVTAVQTVAGIASPESPEVDFRVTGGDSGAEDEPEQETGAVGGEDDDLVQTGSATTGAALLGMVALVAGAAVLTATARRRRG